MKKIISILLTAALCLSFAACSSDTPASEDVSSGNSVENAQDTQIEEKDEQVEFEKITVVDNDYCLIEITELEWNKKNPEVKVLIENKTSDINQMFSVEFATLNGIDSDPFWATDVAPGKKANDTISLSLNDIIKSEVDKVTDIQIDFRVYDYDDWMADDLANETVHIYPYGEDKAEKFIREDESTDIVFADIAEGKIVAIGVDPDDLFGYEVLVYIENKTDSPLVFSTDGVSVNGFMCDPFWSTQVPANSTAIESIQWYDYTVEEAGIESIDDVEMTLRIYNSDSWVDYFEDVVSFSTSTLPEK